MFKILKVEPIDDYAKLAMIHSCGSHDADQESIDGYEIQFTIEVDNKQFLIIYQTEDRYDRIKGYNGYEMAFGGIFGCDADQSAEFIDYCIKHNIEAYEQFLDQLMSEAENYASQKLQTLIAEAKAEAEE